MTDTTICIRSCKADMTSYDGFVWPTSGHVEAPDWDPEPECGHGLHGLRAGNNGPGSWYADGRYLALSVPTDSIVELDGKCKFPSCEVLYVTDSMLGLSAWLQEHGHVGPWYRGHATAGNYATATAGNYGFATAGDNATATAGNYGFATAGDNGTATAGYCGHAAAGYCGHATAGGDGHATAGSYGTATAGYGGVIIICDYFDRPIVGVVGRDGIKANTPYHVEGNKLVEGKARD